MSDKRGRELVRKAENGDSDAAAAALVHGSRRGDNDLVVQAIEAAVGSLDTDILDTILYTVGAELATREVDIKAGRETYKAGELHMPELGQVSLGRFVFEVVDFVEKLQSGDKSAAKLMRDNQTWTWGRPRRNINRNTQINSAKKVLEKAEGIMIGSSSKLRIYALKPADPEKARKKLEKKAKEIEAKLKNAERQKRDQERRMKELQAQLKTQEKAQKALKERLKKDLEKAKKELGEHGSA